MTVPEVPSRWIGRGHPMRAGIARSKGASSRRHASAHRLHRFLRSPRCRRIAPRPSRRRPAATPSRMMRMACRRRARATSFGRAAADVEDQHAWRRLHRCRGRRRRRQACLRLAVDDLELKSRFGRTLAMKSSPLAARCGRPPSRSGARRLTLRQLSLLAQTRSASMVRSIAVSLSLPLSRAPRRGERCAKRHRRRGNRPGGRLRDQQTAIVGAEIESTIYEAAVSGGVVHGPIGLGFFVLGPPAAPVGGPGIIRPTAARVQIFLPGSQRPHVLNARREQSRLPNSFCWRQFTSLRPGKASVRFKLKLRQLRELTRHYCIFTKPCTPG